MVLTNQHFRYIAHRCSSWLQQPWADTWTRPAPVKKKKPKNDPIKSEDSKSSKHRFTKICILGVQMHQQYMHVSRLLVGKQKICFTVRNKNVLLWWLSGCMKCLANILLQLICDAESQTKPTRVTPRQNTGKGSASWMFTDQNDILYLVAPLPSPCGLAVHIHWF